MRELAIKFVRYLKNHKIFVISLFVLVACSVGLILYFNNSNQKTTLENYYSNTAAPKALQASLVLAEGTVEMDPEGKGEFTTAIVEAKLYVDSVVKTSSASKAVIKFTKGDFLILDENTEIKIVSDNEIKVVVEQVYGKTYSVVEKVEGKTYSITKGETKISALGTEFLVEIPKESGAINVLAYISNVKVEHEAIREEVAEQNKFTFTVKTKSYTRVALNEAEKAGSKTYLDLVARAKETIIAQGITTATAQSGDNTANSSTTNNSNSSSNSTSSGGASGGSSGGESSGTGSSSGGNDSGSGNESSGDDSTPSNIFGKYSATSVESIVNSLGSAVYDDATGDWENPGSGYPTGGVKNYDPVDSDNLYMGVRSGRLYIKWTLGGAIPTSRQTIGSDIIEQLTWNVIVDTDGNTSNNCFGSEKAIAFNIAYHENSQIWYNAYGWSTCQGGTYDGISPDISGTFHTYNSGMGKSTVVVSFALSDIGINVNDSTKIQTWSEAESDNWHHYSFDQTAWVSWTVAEI
jgi:uncharacterized membrane protein YgcG